MATDPFDLPAVPPSIPDWQHSAVEAAESEVRHGRPPTNVELERVQELGLTLELDDQDGAAYHRESSRLVCQRRTALETVLHHAAHHLTDPIFPSHGAEWAGHYLALIRAFVYEGRAAAYRTAFDRHGVHYLPEHRASRVHKATTFAPNKEPGCLARIICDDPPRELLCQMLRREGDVLTVRDRTGEHELTLEEIRYVSYALRSRRPSHR